MTLSLPSIPKRKVEYAQFHTPHGPMTLPVNPHEAIWHAVPTYEDSQTVYQLSGDPLSFEKHTDAIGYSSLDEAISTIRATNPAPAPGTRCVTLSNAHTLVVHDPLLVDPDSLTREQAFQLRQYLLDTGPLSTERPYIAPTFAYRFPDLFYTKNKAQGIVAARPLRTKAKRKTPVMAVAVESTPEPAVAKPTPDQIHASLLHLPAVNKWENKARRTWFINRGCIPIPYHRRFFQALHSICNPILAQLPYQKQHRPHLFRAHKFQHLDEPLSCNHCVVVDLPTGSFDTSRDWHGEFNESRHLRCVQSEPDYIEELNFFSRINDHMADILEFLHSPDLVFIACPTYRPLVASARFPNPFLHFIFRYRLREMRNALSYYHNYLPHLLRPIESCDRVSRPLDFTKRNRALARNLIRFQRTLGLRTYPDQAECATHLTQEELCLL